jgi:ketosteroid isomerase-like protein
MEEFKFFTFSDYKVDVNISGEYAFSTETYNYTIIVAKNSKVLKRKGIGTSVLKKMNGEWKIMVSHNSSRK